MTKVCQQILLEHPCPCHHISQQILLKHQGPNNDIFHHQCMESIMFGDTTDKGNLVEANGNRKMRKRQYQPIHPYYHTSIYPTIRIL